MSDAQRVTFNVDADEREATIIINRPGVKHPATIFVRLTDNDKGVMVIAVNTEGCEVDAGYFSLDAMEIGERHVEPSHR